MPTKTNVTMNGDYPEVFSVGIATGDSRQFVNLSLSALRTLKGQVNDALAEYEQLKRSNFSDCCPPQ